MYFLESNPPLVLVDLVVVVILLVVHLPYGSHSILLASSFTPASFKA